MSAIPTSVLFMLLGLLVVLSAFFSSAETALMTLNRYRLRHLAESGNRSARLADRLLSRPDRLIGVILLGNNFVNILASSLATIIALRLGGEAAIAIAAGTLTLVILIFAEVAPKTMAALHPERLAFPFAWPLAGLLRVTYPLVWLVNLGANTLLRLFGINPNIGRDDNLSRDELRTVVREAGALIPNRHQRMLLNLLDLEHARVDDIMVPRSDIVGIDIEAPIDAVLRQLAQAQHTRLPVYRHGIDEIVGILHLRNVIGDLERGRLDKDSLLARTRDCYFVPEGTGLNTQLLNFQHNRRRIGIVVDEYGDVIGLITLEDILEEVVGEFTTDPAENSRKLHRLDDGRMLAQGNASVRELRRVLDWNLPEEGPRTLNGLILEQLQTIPEPGISMRIHGMAVTIVQVRDNRVVTAELQPGV